MTVQQHHRARVPIKVFLQGTISVAVAVLVLAMSLLMVGYADQATGRIGTRLVAAEADIVARRLADDMEDALRAAWYADGELRSLVDSCSGVAVGGDCGAATRVVEVLLRSFALADNSPRASVSVCSNSSWAGGNATLVGMPGGANITFVPWEPSAAWTATINFTSVDVAVLPTAPVELADCDPRPAGIAVEFQSTLLAVVVGTREVELQSRPNNGTWALIRVPLNASALLQRSTRVDHDMYPVSYAVLSAGVTLFQSHSDADGAGLAASALVPGPMAPVFTATARINAASLFDRIKRALMLVIFVTIGVGVAVAAASSLLVWFVVQPVQRLSRDMEALGRLEVAEVSQHRSIIAETEEIAASMANLVDLVREVREHIPNTAAEDEYAGSDDEGDLHVQPTMQVLKCRIHVTYEGRKTLREIATAAFDFLYTETDGDLFERLCDECKEACDEDEFEPVSLSYTNVAGDAVPLRHSIQLQELLAAAPTALSISMQKRNAPRYGIVVTGTFDVVNAAVTIAYAVYLLQSGVERTASIPFICLYVFALAMNLSLAIALLRKGAELPRFDRWLQRSSAETAICLVLCTANLQDMEVLWCSIHAKRRLRFNAPEHPALLQRAVSMSVFGFLFSDVTQLLFKIWLLANADGSVDQFSVIALVTSGLSVLFNLIFKLHALLLQAPPAEESHTAAAESHDSGSLVRKETSLVLAQFCLPQHIRQLQLQGIEVNEFYRTVDELTKEAGGVILMMQSGAVLVAFNVTRRAADHAEAAVSFALDLTQRCAAAGRPVNAAITTGAFMVGMLGTLAVKSMQCFANIDELSRACAIGAASNVAVFLLGSTLDALGLERFVGETVFARLVGQHDNLCGVDLPVSFPALLNDTLPAAQRETRTEVLGIAGGSDSNPVDLRPSEVMAATGAVALEEAKTAAERFLVAYAELHQQREHARKTALNIYQLSTLHVKSILEGIV
jgi:hypothetical protein